MKVLTAFGQYQYGDPSRGVGTEYAAFIPALQRLGHEVVHFDSWHVRPNQTLADLNASLFERTKSERPDLLLAVPFTHELWLETIDAINRLGVRTVCWTTDDSWKYREQSRFLGKVFQVMTTTYQQVLPQYRRDKIKRVILTQWAARAEELQPPIPAADCRYDVTFVGAAHGTRRETVERLRSQGFHVDCFGHGWPSGSIAAEEIGPTMRQSRISLNFANSTGANQIKARTFEVPGAGGFLLTEAAEGLDQFYQIGEEIEVFQSFAELCQKIDFYRANPALRDQVAQAGYQRTSAQHTYDQRLAEIIQFAMADETSDSRNLQAVDFVNDQPLHSAITRHRITPSLELSRRALLTTCRFIWGEQRGQRAARRIVHELSWRCFGEQSYSASGWTGRMFPAR